MRGGLGFHGEWGEADIHADWPIKEMCRSEEPSQKILHGNTDAPETENKVTKATPVFFRGKSYDVVIESIGGIKVTEQDSGDTVLKIKPTVGSHGLSHLSGRSGLIAYAEKDTFHIIYSFQFTRKIVCEIFDSDFQKNPRVGIRFAAGRQPRPQ